MNILPGWQRWISALISPEQGPELTNLLQKRQETLPVLWLMGKTGAGKTSIIQRLTGDTRAQIGNGFEPCTNGSAYYDYPAEVPVMRFLDTRGLGEAHYHPADDMALARRGSHALLVITRVDDQSQGEVYDALRQLSLQSGELAVLQVHTALHAVDSPALDRARQQNESLLAATLGFSPPAVSIDFTNPADGFEDPDRGIKELRRSIVDLVPDLSRILTQRTGSNEEESIFLHRRKEILGYCGAAAAVDLLPALGLVAVPSIQGKMLHALAGRYGIAWDKRMASEFVAALGSSFLYRYLWSLAGRQLAKFIPVYGQSAGAAAAASISFASTYALGRTVCLYLYRRNHQQALDPDALRTAFKDAFKEQQRQ